MNPSQINRRNFLRVGAAAAAGMAAGLTNATPASGPVQIGEEQVLFRMLGKTGIKLPIVSIGVMRADNPNILKAAYKLGVKHYDTAHGYQDGRNEEMVGVFFKDKPRDSFIVSTKIHPPKGGISTSEFMDMIDLSLKRLQMDYVDILYLHAASDRDYMLDERYLEALRMAKEQGKTRFVGVSTHRNMADLINAVVETEFYDIVLTSFNFRHAQDEPLQEALKRAHDAGIGIIGMKNMAGGWMDEERTQPVNGKAALKWVLSNPYIHTCIPGVVSYEQLMENWSVANDITLSQPEMESLKLAMTQTGMFCLGCDDCRNQCPQGLPVAEFMRAYMYNYAYGYPAKAYDTVASLGATNNPCVDCAECVVHCRAGFNVRGKITDIARIQDVPGAFLV
jgi:predicted aldo/keto reductase-like oxidoreductase